jgi:uncharacterized membrane protein
LPERSFFFKGKQFPVCARCTGVFLGRLGAFAAFWWVKVSPWLPIAFLAIMFADWGAQHLKIKESSNIRRLVTGALGGFGLVYLALWSVTWVVEYFVA